MCTAAAVLGGCGTPDNGGIDISFGPANMSTSFPVTTAEGSTSGGADDASTTTGDPTADPSGEPPDDPMPTTDAPAAEDTSTGDESSDDGSSGGESGVECVGLDQATCTTTFGCGWPVGDGIFDMTNGPCGWDPEACVGLDATSCASSPACVSTQNEQNQTVCTATVCELLDQVACPTVVGCVWYAEAEAGGFCFGNGFG